MTTSAYESPASTGRSWAGGMLYRSTGGQCTVQPPSQDYVRLAHATAPFPFFQVKYYFSRSFFLLSVFSIFSTSLVETPR